MDGKKKSGGKFCVAGLPGKVSCTNTSYTPGISMHYFPKNPSVRKQWKRFVKVHRPDFEPTDTSVLCSAHFEASCYTRLSLEVIQAEPGTARPPEKRVLERGSVPTIYDPKKKLETPTDSDRDRRQQQKWIKGVQKQNEAEGAMNRMEDGVGNDSMCENPESVEVDPAVASPDKLDEMDVDPNDKLCQTDDLLPETRVKATQTVHLDCEKCLPRKQKIRALQKQNWRLKAQRDKWKESATQVGCDTVSEESSQDDSDDGCLDEDVIDNEPQLDDADDNDDPDYAALEDEGEREENSDDEEKAQTPATGISVNKDVRPENEPKFIVFYRPLLFIFSMFCFNCKAENPKVTMKTNGTSVNVNQDCKECEGFTWNSQPLILGRYPAGNVMLSFGILMAGASVTKVLLIFRHMGLCAYSARTFFSHQSKFLFPAILAHWEKARSAMLAEIKRCKEAVWSGDGRFDSMGHSAKYGAYTMFCCTVAKIAHFELIQANQCKSSSGMELRGAQDCFTFLEVSGLAVMVFVSDRHRSIAKWIRENRPDTKHFFDIWHVAKSIQKKLLKLGKESGCDVLTKWQKSIRNHLYWCATSTKIGFEELILAKWKSLIRHLTNKHKNHPDSLFKKCAHPRLTQPRDWIKVGTIAYTKVAKMLSDTRLQNDIKKLSGHDQTSCLEGFHSTLNQFHPKMTCFSWLGSYCRHVLASLHFNENLQRETKKNKQGEDYLQVTYPKYKLGDEVVREIRVSPTYDYVDDIKTEMFSMTSEERDTVRSKYKGKVPAPLNTQFADRSTRADSVAHYRKRKQENAVLFPAAQEQDSLQESVSTSKPAKKRKKAGGQQSRQKKRTQEPRRNKRKV